MCSPSVCPAMSDNCLQLEEQKLLQLLMQLRGTLPDDCPALQDEPGRMSELLDSFEQRSGNSAHQPWKLAGSVEVLELIFDQNIQ